MKAESGLGMSLEDMIKANRKQTAKKKKTPSKSPSNKAQGKGKKQKKPQEAPQKFPPSLSLSVVFLSHELCQLSNFN